MKKIISILLMLSVCTNTFAATKADLKQVVDEFSFNTSVEWDQKDKKQFDAYVANFEQQLSFLMSHGLTNEDVLKFAQDRIKDPVKFEVFKMKIKNLSSEGDLSKSLSDLLIENKNDFYAQGASWSGDILDVGLALMIAAAVALIAYAVWFGVTHECTQWNECGRYRCYRYERDDDGDRVKDYYYRSYDDGNHCACDKTCDNWVKKEKYQ
jgi:hypothetical protein